MEWHQQVGWAHTGVMDGWVMDKTEGRNACGDAAVAGRIKDTTIEVIFFYISP